MGMPASTFFNELIEGLTLFFSIIDMVLLVTPARLASSRCDRPLSLRMDCSRIPTSNAGVPLGKIRKRVRIIATVFSIYNTYVHKPFPDADSTPEIDGLHPAQVAEQLIRNGLGTGGHIAGQHLLAP